MVISRTAFYQPDAARSFDHVLLCGQHQANGLCAILCGGQWKAAGSLPPIRDRLL